MIPFFEPQINFLGDAKPPKSPILGRQTSNNPQFWGKFMCKKWVEDSKPHKIPNFGANSCEKEDFEDTKPHSKLDFGANLPPKYLIVGTQNPLLIPIKPQNPKSFFFFFFHLGSSLPLLFPAGKIPKIPRFAPFLGVWWHTVPLSLFPLERWEGAQNGGKNREFLWDEVKAFPPHAASSSSSSFPSSPFFGMKRRFFGKGTKGSFQGAGGELRAPLGIFGGLFWFILIYFGLFWFIFLFFNVFIGFFCFVLVFFRSFLAFSVCF